MVQVAVMAICIGNSGKSGNDDNTGNSGKSGSDGNTGNCGKSGSEIQETLVTVVVIAIQVTVV